MSSIKDFKDCRILMASILVSRAKRFMNLLGIESGNVRVVYVTEETPRAITIFPTLRKRMGLADTLTARSQMFHASLRSRLEHGT